MVLKCIKVGMLKNKGEKMYKGLTAYIYRSAHYDCKLNEMYGKFGKSNR